MCNILRLFPEEQHDRQAQQAAGEAVENRCKGSEKEAGKHDLGQHQQEAAFPVHQIDRIQEDRVGQSELDAGNGSPQDGGERNGAVQETQHQRQRRQQAETGDTLCRLVQTRRLLPALLIYIL